MATLQGRERGRETNAVSETKGIGTERGDVRFDEPRNRMQPGYRHRGPEMATVPLLIQGGPLGRGPAAHRDQELQDMQLATRDVIEGRGHGHGSLVPAIQLGRHHPGV